MTWSTDQPTPSSRLPASSCRRGLRVPALPVTEPAFRGSSRPAAGAGRTERVVGPGQAAGPPVPRRSGGLDDDHSPTSTARTMSEENVKTARDEAEALNRGLM